MTNIQIVPPIEAAIAARRSIRRYGPDAVSDTSLQRLLAAAIAAPSAHNRQPWRFAVLRQLVTKQALADAMGARLAQDRSRDGDAPDAIARDVDRSRERITRAPVVLVVCLTLEDMDVYPDPQRARAEHLMAVQSTAMAVQNLLLAATAQGLGACWMCAPLFCPDTVRSAVGLPAAWQPQALVTLGVPAESGKDRPRKPLAEVALQL